VIKPVLFAAALTVAFASPVALVESSAVAATSSVRAQQSSWYKARARLESDGALKGKADYRDRPKRGTTEQRLQVKIENATPGEQFDVRFNGDVIGTITANSLGIAKLKLRTARFIDSPNWLPIPDNFPRIVTGDEITVGPASGVFQER